MAKRVDAEDRRQRRLHRLGTQNPRCVGCLESDPCVLELHHIAGQQHGDELAIVCRNCHGKLSDKQRDHGVLAPLTPMGQYEDIGHYLLGLADLFVKIGETLRRFGNLLIGESK